MGRAQGPQRAASRGPARAVDVDAVIARERERPRPLRVKAHLRDRGRGAHDLALLTARSTGENPDPVPVRLLPRLAPRVAQAARRPLSRERSGRP